MKQKRRVYRKKKPTTTGVVKRLLNAPGRSLKPLARKLEKEIGEKKYYALAVSNPLEGALISNLGSVGSLSSVPQGDSDTTRDGDQLTISSLEIRYNMFLNIVSAAATNPQEINNMRLIIFQWYPDSTPIVSDILLTTHVLAPYQHDKRFMFKILYDKSHILTCQNTTVVAANVNSSIVQHIRLNRGYKRKIQYA